MRDTSAEYLVKVYKQLIQQLRSHDPDARHFALMAITQIPPAFLEPLFLELADDMPTAMAIIPGLKRLAKRAAKEKR